MDAIVAQATDAKFLRCPAWMRSAFPILLAVLVLTLAPRIVPAQGEQPASSAPKVDLLGDALPEGAVVRAGSARLRPGDFISQLVFSSDGKQLISSARDTQFCIWDAKTGKLIRRNDFNRASIFAVNYPPSGPPLAVVRSSDGKLHLWDFMREKDGFPGSSDAVNPNVPRVFDQTEIEFQNLRTFAISADGYLLAGASSESNEFSKLQFWKAEPGKELRELTKLRTVPQVAGYLDQLRFSENGTRLVGVTRNINSKARTPDGQLLQDAAAIVWDVASGKELIRFPLNNQSDWASAVSPDGTLMAFSAQGDSLDLFNLKTGEQLHRLECFGYVRGASFSKSGKFLATGGRDQIVRVWDVATAKVVQQFAGHQVTVEAVAFSPDEKILASGGQDGIIRLWDVASGKELIESDSHAYQVQALAYAPDGKLIYTGSWDDSVRVWDAETGRLVRKMEWPNVKVNSLSISPDGKLLAVGATQGTNALRIFDTTTGKVVRSFPDQQGVGPNALAFSRDAKWVAAGNVIEAAVHLWDMTTGKEIRDFQHDEQVLNCLAISNNGKLIATAGGTGRMGNDVIRVWNTDTGAPADDMASPKGGVEAMAFLADDKQVVSAGMSSRQQVNQGIITRFENGRVIRSTPAVAQEPSDDSLQRWDLETGLVVSTLQGDEYREGYGARYVYDVAVSPDGKLIASAERRGTVEIYQVADGKRLATLKHGGSLRCVEFSADGHRLASAGSDTSILIWDVDAVIAAKPDEKK